MKEKRLNERREGEEAEDNKKFWKKKVTAYHCSSRKNKNNININKESSTRRTTTMLLQPGHVQKGCLERWKSNPWPLTLESVLGGVHKATSCIWQSAEDFWKYLKEWGMFENFRENCACSECDDSCERTQFPVCVLARTFLLKVLIRPLFKFLGCSKGRRRSRKVGSPFLFSGGPYRMSPPSPIATILLVCSALIGLAEACSSRNTPKPRPPPPSARPNITFPTYTCPPTYAAWYCLNGATCFTIKIEESLLYNCECAEGFMGQRCEFKDLDGSYLPSRQRVLLETASIAGGATIAVFLVVIVCVTLYLHYQRKSKEKRVADTDQKDGPDRDLERRAFNKCLSISMERLPELHSDRTSSKSTSVILGRRELDRSPP